LRRRTALALLATSLVAAALIACLSSSPETVALAARAEIEPGASTAIDPVNLPLNTDPSDARTAVREQELAHRTIDIHGRVVDELDRPIEEFAVHAIHRDENNWLVEQVEWPSAPHPGGDFDLLALAPGRWEITPRAPRLVVTRPELFLCTLDQRIAIEMTGNATLAGVVLDPDGEPVEDAAVWIDGVEREPHTDPRGRFEFEVHHGQRSLVARARGLASSERSVIRVATHERKDEVVLGLRRAASVRATLLFGDQRAPLPGRAVRCSAVRGEVFVSDAGGRFEVAGLDPGELELEVSDADGNFGESISRSATITVRAGEVREIELHMAPDRPVALTVRLTPHRSDRPGSGWLTIEPLEGLLTPRGEYHVDLEQGDEVVLPCPGRFRFKLFGNSDRGFVEHDVEVPDSASFVLDFDLSR
jgi:hypothetical protein